jgi:uncharacterized protein YlzI (FlbEa/FlbD family)
MTTNVLPIIRVNTPNGQHCDVNAYHITMIDYRCDSKGYTYPTVCLSTGATIAVTEEEAERVTRAVSKLSAPPQTVSNTCKYKTPSL